MGKSVQNQQVAGRKQFLRSTTIANILKQNGLEPAPERNCKTTWQEFLRQHWEVLVAADFFTVEVWTRKGLTRFMVLFLIDISMRRVEIGGIAAKTNGLWMDQIARNLCDDVDGFLKGKRYLIHDRDPLFTAEFRDGLAAAGVECVRLPPCSPNLNAHAERFVRTIKSFAWCGCQGFVSGQACTNFRLLAVLQDP